MATKNLTLKLDESIYLGAREIAAARATSVSALVTEFLTDLNLKTPPSDTEMERRKERLQALWKLSDEHSPKGTEALGPFNREDAYEDRLSR